MEKRIIILCLKVDSETTEFIRDHVPGATVVQCVDCGTDLYLAPSSRDARDKGGEPICDECIKPRTDEITAVAITEKARLGAKYMMEDN